MMLYGVRSLTKRRGTEEKTIELMAIAISANIDNK